MNPALPTTRPRSVTLTLWGVFLLGVWNFGRALALLQQRELLQELEARPDPVFRLGMALVWGVMFAGLAVALYRRRPFTRRLLPLMIAVYAFYEIGLILIFTVAGPSTLVLETLLAAGAVGFCYWALNRPVVTQYFEINTP